MKNISLIAKKLIEYAKKKDIYLVLRFQDYKSRAMNIKNGEVDKSEFARVQGVGIHAFTKSGHTGFSSIDSTNNFNLIKHATDKAIKSAQTAQKYEFESSKEIFKLKNTKATIKKDPAKDAFKVKNKKQEKDLLTFHKTLQEQYKEFSISSTIKFSYDYRHIFRSDKTDIEIVSSNSFLSTLLSYSGKEFSNELYHSSSGSGYEVLSSKKKINEHLEILKNKASYIISLRNASNLSDGKYTILIDSEIAGTLIHEAFGHSAETDHVYQKSPLLKNGKVRKGEKIAPEYINIYDYSKKDNVGFTPYSDFGVKREKASIVKNGKINNLLSDIFTARKAGTKLVGAARADFFHSIPIPRMSTTIIEIKGKYNKKLSFDPRKVKIQKLHKELVKMAIFKKYEKIVFLKGFSGGQTDSYSGNFQFGTQFSFLLTKDKITQLKPLSFSGKTNDVLASIKLSFGKSYSSDGQCGKAGQYVPVSDKAPILLLEPNKGLNIG